MTLLGLVTAATSAGPATNGGRAGITDFQDRNGGLGTGYDPTELTEARGFGYLQPVDPSQTMGCYGQALDWTNFQFAFNQPVTWDVHLEADMVCDASVLSGSLNSKLAKSMVALDSWGDIDVYVVNSSIVCHPIFVPLHLQQTYVRGNGVVVTYLSTPLPLGHAISAPWITVTQGKAISLRADRQLNQSSLNFSYWSYGEITLLAQFEECRVEASFRNTAVSPRSDSNWKGSVVQAFLNGRLRGLWHLR